MIYDSYIPNRHHSCVRSPIQTKVQAFEVSRGREAFDGKPHYSRLPPPFDQLIQIKKGDRSRLLKDSL